MYEEGKGHIGFNWLSLIIKLLILAVVVFLACWIFVSIKNKNTNVKKNNPVNNSSIINNNNTNNNTNNDVNEEVNVVTTDYISNINMMKNAAFEYFTSSRLPVVVGESKKLTLQEMLDQKLLIDFTHDGRVCDTDSSFVQATKTADNNYALKVSLDCNNKHDFIVTTIESCCNNTTNSSSKNNSSSSNTSKTSTTKTNTSKTPTKVKTVLDVKIECTNCENKPEYLTVAFDSNGGSSVGSQKVTKNSLVTKPTEPTKDGYQFVEWELDGNSYNFNNPVTKNITLKAVWRVIAKPSRYYRLVRYSDWTSGYSDDYHADNRYVTQTTYNYCKDTTKTYYSTSYVSTNSEAKTYSYEFQMLDINPRDVYESTVSVIASSKAYFSNSSLDDYNAYINQRSRNAVKMTNGNGKYASEMPSANVFKNSSLTKSNFTFDTTGVYLKDGIYRTTITINYKNGYGVTPYRSSNTNIKDLIYMVPVKFDVSYAYKKDCVRDLASNSYKYKNYSISDPESRDGWQHRIAEYRWEPTTELDGWTWTGEYYNS